jgi:hypothetical protein
MITTRLYRVNRNYEHEQCVKNYNNIQTFFFYFFADNSYQEFNSHRNHFSIDLSNPIHIEVKTGVKGFDSAVLDEASDKIWRFSRALG